MNVAGNHMKRLRTEMHVEVDIFVDTLLSLSLAHYVQNAVKMKIDKNIMKIKQDKVLEMEQ